MTWWRACAPRSRRSTATEACRRGSSWSHSTTAPARQRHHQHGPAQPDLRLPADLLHSMGLPWRSAQRHHRRRQYPLRAVFQHHHPGAARGGRQPAVGRGGRFRHHRRCRRHPGREHLSEFPVTAGGKAATAAQPRRGALGSRSHAHLRSVERPGLDRSAAAHPDQCAADRPGGVFFDRDHRRGVHSAVHHARASKARSSARWRAPMPTR